MDTRIPGGDQIADDPTANDRSECGCKVGPGDRSGLNGEQNCLVGSTFAKGNLGFLIGDDNVAQKAARGEVCRQGRRIYERRFTGKPIDHGSSCEWRIWNRSLESVKLRGSKVQSRAHSPWRWKLEVSSHLGGRKRGRGLTKDKKTSNCRAVEPTETCTSSGGAPSRKRKAPEMKPHRQEQKDGWCPKLDG